MRTIRQRMSSRAELLLDSDEEEGHESFRGEYKMLCKRNNSEMPTWSDEAQGAILDTVYIGAIDYSEIWD